MSDRRSITPDLTDPVLLTAGEHRLYTDRNTSIGMPGKSFWSIGGGPFELVEIWKNRTSDGILAPVFAVPQYKISGELRSEQNGITARLENGTTLVFATAGEIDMRTARFYGSPSGLVGLHLSRIGKTLFLVALPLDQSDMPEWRVYTGVDPVDLRDVTDEVTNFGWSGINCHFEYGELQIQIRQDWPGEFTVINNASLKATAEGVGSYDLEFSEGRTRASLNPKGYGPVI